MAELEVLSKANHKKTTAPIKIMQFGEGNFLRAFIDWMIQTMNDSGKYQGHVVVVQPLEMGRVADLAKQDGLYTLILQGLDEKGQAVRKHQIIDVLDDFVNPFLDYQKFLKYGESKDLEVVISNTTEAGITFEEKDVSVDIETTLPLSYPGKLYALLYRRYKVLGPKAGLVAVIFTTT
jgi:tagaturonate reductase